jgi:hypothetical protein
MQRVEININQPQHPRSATERLRQTTALLPSTARPNGVQAAGRNRMLRTHETQLATGILVYMMYWYAYDVTLKTSPLRQHLVPPHHAILFLYMSLLGLAHSLKGFFR